jgi:Nif-specific regulatory protein
VTLGRQRSNTIVLRDDQASRKHAELAFRDGRWYLSNFGSPLNGTLLDGESIAEPVGLEDGQEIGIGDVRLRFNVQDVERPDAPGDSAASTSHRADDLSVLGRFMTASVEDTDARPLLLRALELLVQQSQATFAGFLSLDADAPLPRLIVPEQAHVNVSLSSQLTQRVQQHGEPVWLAAMPGERPGSESLEPYTDALCLPLPAGGTALGALHVYKANGLFRERDLRFGEVLAGYLAGHLRALKARRTLEAENSRLRGHTPSPDQLLGDSAAMRQLRHKIARAAPRPSTVLIRGESGVGKELVALGLHRQSPRCDGPLVVVNCAAIAATLPEAELFGHRKGAFTGADRDRPGLFQLADEGTLFLDEIGELPLDCQAKLLRVIEGKGFRPVGASAEVQVDVRIIAATNRDLELEVKRRAFRQDLLFRLQVIEIHVPPLREHGEDVPQLVGHFLERLALDHRRQIKLTAAALRRLQTYTWPGNVRQLWAVLENAVTMSEGPLLDAADLPLPAAAPTADVQTLDLAQLESWAIRQALQQTKGNVTQAAKLLGVVRDTLSSKMRSRGIQREQS